MLLLQERRVKRIVGLVVELEDGEVVTQTLEGEAVNAVPASLAQAPRTVEVEDTADSPPKKRRGGRRRKAAAPVESTTVSTASPEAYEQSSGSGGESSEKEPNARIVVPIDECLGLCEYQCTNGVKTVVIYKSGFYKKGKRKNQRWYLCLFLSKSGEYAYTFSAKPFFANPAKMTEIRWFTHQAVAA